LELRYEVAAPVSLAGAGVAAAAAAPLVRARSPTQCIHTRCARRARLPASPAAHALMRGCAAPGAPRPAAAARQPRAPCRLHRARPPRYATPHLLARPPPLLGSRARRCGGLLTDRRTPPLPARCRWRCLLGRAGVEEISTNASHYDKQGFLLKYPRQLVEARYNGPDGGSAGGGGGGDGHPDREPGLRAGVWYATVYNTPVRQMMGPPARRAHIRVRAEIMGSHTCRIVGRSQPDRVMISPIISTRPRSPSSTRGRSRGTRGDC
jgi:hypothetical protein